MSNLDLWKKVDKTDPAFVKHVNQRGGYSAISPQYQLKCATDQFGPYGKGFGFESCELDFSQMEVTGLVLVKAVFFYVMEGERFSFPINNAWQAKMGSKFDPDFAKKAETNTMSKALSKLGFSADVYMGQFDDSEYVSVVAGEKALEKAENKLEEERRQREEYAEKCNNELSLLSTATCPNELRKLYTEFVRRADLRQDKKHLVSLERTKDHRKAELINQENRKEAGNEAA